MAGTARTALEQGDNQEIEIFELVKAHNYVIDDLETHRTGVSEFSASSAVTPGSTATSGFEAFDITVTGAALGDFVEVAYSKDMADQTMWAAVTGASTVTVTVFNNSGAGLTLAAGTFYVRTSSPGLVDAAADLDSYTVNAGDKLGI